MIFNSLDFIEKLSVEERLNHLGNKRKKPSSTKTFRSNMMLNPLRLKHINNIDNLNCDMVTLNLEDAIAPSRKKEALHNIAFFLSHLEASNTFIIVRTNPLDEGGREEIAFLDSFSFDAVRVAKVKTRDEILEIGILLNSEKEIHISLETKEAFANLATFGGIEKFTTANWASSVIGRKRQSNHTVHTFKVLGRCTNSWVKSYLIYVSRVQRCRWV